MCASCPGDTVTPRIGSRGETQCVPPDGEPRFRLRVNRDKC